MNNYISYHSFSYAGLKDIGRKRESNQDEIILEPDLGLFGVSDGMGGLQSGELASRYVKETLPSLLRNIAKDWTMPMSASSTEAAIRTAAVHISDRLYEEVNQDGVIMGATVAVVWLMGDEACFLHLGDSRAYILHPNQDTLEQVTEDMNLAGLMVKEGVLTRAEARNHPASSKLTAFVGMRPTATPAVAHVEIQPGDRILLCSDGLYGMLEDAEMASILRSGAEPEEICQKLVDRANEEGGRDNISAVLVSIAD